MIGLSGWRDKPLIFTDSVVRKAKIQIVVINPMTRRGVGRYWS
jgi:hypothetical protein